MSLSATNSIQEEIRMAREPASDVPGLWRRYNSSSVSQDDRTEDELVKAYLPLVKTMVGRMAISLPSHVDTDNLYSAGLLGLLNAIRHFDLKKGTAFEPYARIRIRGAMLDELRRLDWAPRSVHVKARKVQETILQLEQQHGRLPTDEEIAAAMNLSLGEYEQLLGEIRPATFVCLDSADEDLSDDQSDHEILSNPDDQSPAEVISRAELSALIAERIEQLPDFYRKIIALYYYEGLRVGEIAKATGFCPAHICQTHTKAILAIRSYIEGHERAALARRNPNPSRT